MSKPIFTTAVVSGEIFTIQGPCAWPILNKDVKMAKRDDNYVFTCYGDDYKLGRNKEYAWALLVKLTKATSSHAVSKLMTEAHSEYMIDCYYEDQEKEELAQRATQSTCTISHGDVLVYSQTNDFMNAYFGKPTYSFTVYFYDECDEAWYTKRVSFKWVMYRVTRGMNFKVIGSEEENKHIDAVTAPFIADSFGDILEDVMTPDSIAVA